MQFLNRSVFISYGAAILIVMCFSCTDDKREHAISQIPVEFKLYRFDLEFAQTEPEGLKDIKIKYPYFFPEQVPDSIWEAKLKDSLQSELEQEVAKVFPNNDELEEDLRSVFQHIKYYFPETKLPSTVVTTTSEVDYRHKVILTDSVIVVSLDTFLGSENALYSGVYDYIKIGMTKDRIAPELALEFASQIIPPINRPTLVEAMVQEGQKLYAAQQLSPSISEALLLGYTDGEYEWTEANARFLWEYFITNDFLFSTEPQLFNRFVALAPFSKFYLEIDRESPGGVGKYLGLQIVKSFMERAETDLKGLLTTRPEVIFNKAKYKP